MKLKLSVDGSDGTLRDVLVTTDVTTTVGELARAIVLGYPAAHPLATEARDPRFALSLRAQRVGETVPLLLDNLETLGAAGLQSGARVQAVPAGFLAPGDRLTAVSVGEFVIVGGERSGSTIALVAGSNLVGRDRLARVRLGGGETSRKHAVVEVLGGEATIRDLGSANGVLVDGVAITSAVLASGSRVQIGEHVLEYRRTISDAELVGASARGPLVEFVRPPRVDGRFPARRVVVPEPPQRPGPSRLPILAALAPALAGGVLFAISHQIITLVFLALSPITLLAGYIDAQLGGRRQHKRDLAEFNRSLTTLGTRLDELRGTEVQARIAETADAATIVRAVVARDPLLWSRRSEHQSFLELRFGLGADSSLISVDAPERGTIEGTTWERIESFVEGYRLVGPVPLLENLRDSGSIGVVGEAVAATAAYRALIAQLVGLHSPAELVLCGLAERGGVDDWGWLKWLPHVDSVHSPLGTSHLAADERGAGRLVTRLEEILAVRRSAGGGEEVRSHLPDDTRVVTRHGEAVSSVPSTPVIVVLVMDVQGVDPGRLVSLAEHGPDFGIHTLWLAPRVADLPAACRTYLDVLHPASARLGFVRSGVTLQVDTVEQLDVASADALARSLSAVTDVGARVVDDSDLPGAIALRDLNQYDVTGSAQAVVAAWRDSGTLTSTWALGTPREADRLEAVVGQGVVGPFTLDLRAQGPHALVGGTTGAGKSEFLQTWIMSMAARYSPDRLTFLLVDYKGGAAFAECTRLPHTVGLVTDLTQHLVRRALTSLRAELHYREELLNAKGAKDLATLEKASDPDAPPSLVIVIDEFAALAKDVPEFVDGVVDVAARGRSLGVHLIMATQRPSGVISDNLRANTNLRVALRMADPVESKDVIDSDRAAYIDATTPGRGAVRVGPGRIIDFQTAYVGGVLGAAAEADITVTELPFGYGRDWARPAVRDTGSDGGERVREIGRMLETVTSATAACGIRSPRRPWLDQLPEALDAFELSSRDAGYVLGLTDVPDQQSQAPFVFDPDRAGNILFVGTSGAGTSTALRTLAAVASSSATEDLAHVYAIDGGGGSLGVLEDLPTVGSVIDVDDGERVLRLLTRLGEEVRARGAAFAAARASSITEYRTRTGIETPRIILLVDNLGALREKYEFARNSNVVGQLTALLSAGRPLGIHIAVAAERPASVSSGMLGSIQEVVTMRLANSQEYIARGASEDVLGQAPAGRCVARGQETQLGTAGAATSIGDEALVLAELSERLVAAGVPAALPIERLPARIGLDDLPATDDSGNPVFAVADDTLTPFGAELSSLLVVQGRFRTGTTSAVRTLVRAALRARPQLQPVLLSTARTVLATSVPWAAQAVTDEETVALTALLRASLGLPAEAPRTASWLDDDWLGGSGSGSGADAEEKDEEPEAPVAPAAPAFDPSTLLVVVESAGEFAGLAAEKEIVAVLRECRRRDVPVIVESDPATINGAWDLYGLLKTARSGIALKPDEGDTVALFRVDLPREDRAADPPGRGYYIESGSIRKLQMASDD